MEVSTAVNMERISLIQSNPSSVLLFRVFTKIDDK
jgi:hypothetical protein